MIQDVFYSCNATFYQWKLIGLIHLADFINGIDKSLWSDNQWMMQEANNFHIHDK